MLTPSRLSMKKKKKDTLQLTLQQRFVCWLSKHDIPWSIEVFPQALGRLEFALNIDGDLYNRASNVDDALALAANYILMDERFQFNSLRPVVVKANF